MDDLTALARQQLDDAKADPHGRSARLFLHDGPLRQTVIALIGGASLDEHVSPPAGSVQILHGHVQITTGDGKQDMIAGQVAPVPREKHGVTAVENSALLLTSVTHVDGM
ncbi:MULTISPECIES: cupin [Streptomyces]|nr:cupin [Streptomyces niger]